MKGFLIVSGGVLEDSFARDFIRAHADFRILAADRGLECLQRIGVRPDLILGDYDSVREEVLAAGKAEGIPMETFPAKKDFTDTEAALDYALRMGAEEIRIIGAGGGRLDHFLCNLQGLLRPFGKGVPAYLEDPQNRIFLAGKPFTCRRQDAYGRYFSLLPFTDRVKDLSVTGMKYPLSHHDLEKGTSLCVSNEITEETAAVSFSEGILIVIQSKDKEQI